jgi:spoIIIJ-associated protein
MDELMAKGKTVDEAIANGLKEMGLSLDEVEIEILDDGSGSLLGFGKTKVMLTRKMGNAGKAEEFLTEIFAKMGVSANLNVEESEEEISIDIIGSSLGVLIGHRGETLDALQYLTSLVVNKDTETYKRLLLDTENYRQKRESALIKLANKLAKKVIDTNRRVKLEPMNPYERRVIHATLQGNPKIRTYSQGEEPHRNVVIEKVR